MNSDGTTGPPCSASEFQLRLREVLVRRRGWVGNRCVGGRRGDGTVAGGASQPVGVGGGLDDLPAEGQSVHDRRTQPRLGERPSQPSGAGTLFVIVEIRCWLGLSVVSAFCPSSRCSRSMSGAALTVQVRRRCACGRGAAADSGWRGGRRADRVGLVAVSAPVAAQIEAAFGVKLVCPVDDFNASRHVDDDSPELLQPPTPERVSEFLRVHEEPDRDRAQVCARSMGLRVVPDALSRRLRSEEAALLDVPNVHFDRGPLGKLHVRFGKGAKMSGPRPRWAPMLDGLDLALRWFLADVRPKFPTRRCCSPTSPPARCIAGRSATGCGI
jgi:hypothetical protein